MVYKFKLISLHALTIKTIELTSSLPSGTFFFYLINSAWECHPVLLGFFIANESCFFKSRSLSLL